MRLAILSILALAFLGLPLLGVHLQGMSLSPYLEFPPKTRQVIHAPFSWAAFWAFFAVTVSFAAPFAARYLRTRTRFQNKPGSRSVFPWWGWLGMGTGLSAWVLAWTRFSWFSVLQPHTFTPLWLSFILVVNGLSWRRQGRSLMTHRTRFFLLLFPLSAIFWWFFEYLNRFVHNWIYVESAYNAWEYFAYATIPFSTVLPAVLSLSEWFYSSPTIQRAYADFVAVPWALRRDVAFLVLMAAATGLACIGVYPDYLFPFLWVSPLLMGICLLTIFGEPHLLTNAFEHGDWRLAVSSALAALVCGLFWEMWNFYSLSKWHYSIPFVHRFEIFEMPILGYGGYLPFGITCAFFAEFLEGSSGEGGNL